MLDLLLPERCLHCGEPTAHATLGAPIKHTLLPKYLCGVCIRVLLTDDMPKASSFNQLHRHSGKSIATSSARFHFVETSPIQSLIHHFKYQGMPKLAYECGSILSEDAAENQFDFVVPVPLHRTRLFERGYNQAEELARGFALHAGGKVLRAAKRTRPTPTQTSLKFAERLQNVKGAFELTNEGAQIRGKRIAIIDDVMTTGSTIASVAEALATAEPASISSVTLSVAALQDS